MTNSEGSIESLVKTCDYWVGYIEDTFWVWWLLSYGVYWWLSRDVELGWLRYEICFVMAGIVCLLSMGVLKLITNGLWYWLHWTKH